MKTTLQHLAGDDFGRRLAGHVANRLGCVVEFVRFDRDRKTGADVPLFVVPAEMLDAAMVLGLRVETK